MGRHYSESDLLESDIVEIRDYIAKDSPEYAEKVLTAIYGTLKKIERDPERFSTYSPKTFRNNNLRRAVCLPYKNYLVFYELTSKAVRILYVRHGARDFEASPHFERRI